MVISISVERGHEWGMGGKLDSEAGRQDAETEISRLLEVSDQKAQEIIQVQEANAERLA